MATMEPIKEEEDKEELEGEEGEGVEEGEEEGSSTKRLAPITK